MEISSGEVLQMLANLVKSNKKRIVAGALVSALLIGYRNKVNNAAQQKTASKLHVNVNVKPTEGSKKKISKEFMSQLMALLKIAIPGFGSKEFFILLLHTSFLFSRTFASLIIAKMDGYLVKNIVEGRPDLFAVNLLKWLAIALPASYINSMIRYLESKLALAIRTRLTSYAYNKYMSNNTHYRVSNLDSRLNNPDQCLTEDVAKFSSNLAHIYSQISKPSFDVLLMGGQLVYLASAKSGGKSTIIPTLIAGVVVYLTAKLLQFIAPPFGRMAGEQTELEGELRFCHSRLLTNAEEIVFYGGQNIERNVLREAFSSLAKHLEMTYRSSIFYHMMEGFLMKYMWSAAGLVMIALPIFTSDQGQTEADVSTRTGDFITVRKLLVNSADAIERIMSVFKEISTLAGYTSRVHFMLSVFDEMAEGKYQKKSLSPSPSPSLPLPLSSEIEDQQKKVPKKEVIEIKEDRQQVVPMTKSGKVVIGDKIKFTDVSVVTPNGDLLIKDLSFEVLPGQHVLVAGPNGCGKTSLLRVLAGLWPITSGEVVRPKEEEIFYVPQRSYLPLGSLRDQIIYPDTAREMREKGRTDRELLEILQKVVLTNILQREGIRREGKGRGKGKGEGKGEEKKQGEGEKGQGLGLEDDEELSGVFDVVNDWKDVLSGGEKQKIGMARMIYHRPKFAILDECTSAVSIDAEEIIYANAKLLGITLISISHKPSLLPLHSFLLKFDGHLGGKVVFSPLNASTRESLEKEREALEKELEGVPALQDRLKELCGLLGEDSEVLDSILKDEQEERGEKEEGQ